MTLADVRFAVVDVETSGLSVRRHRLLQVGLVVVAEDGRVFDRWSSLVRPRVPWLHRIGPRHIHGISRRELATAPPRADVLSELCRRLTGCVIVAHNASFDLAFLRRACERARVPGEGQHPFGKGSALCTLEMSRLLDPGRQLSHRLVDVCQRYGVQILRAHDALADADATAAIVPHLLHAHGVDSAEALAALLAAGAPRPAQQLPVAQLPV